MSCETEGIGRELGRLSEQSKRAGALMRNRRPAGPGGRSDLITDAIVGFVV